MSFISTIPGAVAVLEGYMSTVASASSVSDVNVYVGYSAPTPSYNYMMVGDYEEGLLMTRIASTWATFPAAAKRRTEEYSLVGHIRTWAGGYDWQSRLNDAFALLDALQDQILGDPQGSGALTTAGAWGSFDSTMKANGPLGDPTGWGVVIEFELSVLNARVTG